jgi:hypothetical protein
LLWKHWVIPLFPVKGHVEAIPSDQAEESMAELYQLCPAGLAQLVNGPQKARHQWLARLAGAMLFSAAGSTAAV